MAAALMVVIRRAMKDGRDAAIAAKQSLLSNNPATQPFLMMLPDDGPLPKMKHLEQQASEQLLRSLTTLTNQCDAAHCHALEVFTRSVHCTTHKAAMESLAIKGRIYQRQQQMEQLDETLARRKRRLTTAPPVLECLKALQELGVPAHVAALTVTFMQTYRL